MAKNKSERSFLSKVARNSYLRMLVLMIIIGGLIIALVLVWLNIYTKHGESVAVPSVRGIQVEEAANILKGSSLRFEVIDSIFLTDGKPGAITDQVPEEGSFVKKGRTIFLTMQAKGVEMITIPPLKDFSQRQAIATLNSLGFANIVITEVQSAYRGLVIDITYKGRSIGDNEKLPKGDAIGLTVGTGGEVLIDSIIDFIPETNSQNLNLSSNNAPSVDNSFFE